MNDLESTQNGPVLVREATMADAAAVAHLVSQLGYLTGPVQMARRLAKVLSEPGYATYVAEVRDVVAGVVGVRLGLYYERPGTYAQIVLLSVDRKAQGVGVGRALLTAAERWAHRRGASAVLVHSGQQRTEAHAFYERMGYVATGLRFVKELRRRPRE